MGSNARHDYYAFTRHVATLAGRSLTYFTKPGVPATDARDGLTRLLCEHVVLAPEAHWLDLGCGTGLAGTFLAHRAPDATLADASVSAVACAARTLAANGHASVPALHAPGVPPGVYDVILARLPRGVALAEHLLRAAGAALRDGGTLYLAGATETGIKTFITRASALFGNGATLGYKGGCRIAAFTKNGPLEAPAPDDGLCETSVMLNDTPVTLVSGPGVFALERVDPGTAALCAHMAVPPLGRVLDLGCGAGVLGLRAAQLGAERIVMLDADARALAATRATLAVNGVTHAEVRASDCGQAVLGEQFDVVVTNPPFHQGHGVDYAVAYQFIRDAHSVLTEDGALFLVANAFIAYERILAQYFAEQATLFNDRKFKVIRAQGALPSVP